MLAWGKTDNDSVTAKYAEMKLQAPKKEKYIR